MAVRLRDLAISYVWYWSVTVVSNRLWFGYPIVLLHVVLGLLFSNDLSTHVHLRNRPRIYHGFGIIVGSNVIIGRDVVLRAHVCLGASSLNSSQGPTIGDNVVFGVGAMVFGAAEVPPGSLVKANQVFKAEEA